MYIQRQLVFRRTACLLHWLLLASMVLALLPAPAGATPLVSATLSTATPPLSATAAPTSALQEVNTLFWPNRGHVDPAVQYELRTAAGLLLFAPDAITVAAQETTVTPIRLRFTGANSNPMVEGVAQSGVRLHSYVGNDPSQWQVDRALHKAIRYRQLYPGIDLHYDTSAGLLKGTYFVDPGVDPRQIRWRYEGAERVEIDETTGDLVITLADEGKKTRREEDKETGGNYQATPPYPSPDWGGHGLAVNGSSPYQGEARRGLAATTGETVAPRTLTEKAPIAWQEINGQRLPVTVKFQIQYPIPNIQYPFISFHLGDYNPAYPLVIDPTLEYSSALAYASTNFPAQIKSDAAGNVYIVGAYEFPSFRSTPLLTGLQPRGLACEYYSGALYPCHDAFVIKLDSAGRPQYIVSLGGSYNDTAFALAPDNQGNLYVGGVTHSRDFPRTTALTPGANVAACEAYDRTRRRTQFHLFGPGIFNDAFLTLHACAGFVARFDAAGHLAIASYLPLASNATVRDLALDSVGNLWVTGGQGGKAYLLKMDGALSQQLYYNDSFAGNESAATSLAIDGQGRLWSAGTVFGAGTTAAYLARLNGDGSGLNLAFFGQESAGVDVALDGQDAAYLLGRTTAANVQSYLDPQSVQGATGVTGVFQPTFGGSVDAFVAKYNANFVKTYVTYLGGADSDDPAAITVDANGNALVFGTTRSADFPTLATLQPLAFGPQGHVNSEISTFLTQINRFGTALIFSTFFGGEGPTIGAGSGRPQDLVNEDFASSVTLDRNGKVWITGYATSNPFPFLNGYASCCGGGGRNGFVARFDPAIYPVVYVPGVASSMLADSQGNEYWLALFSSRSQQTTLYPDVPHPDLFAPDVLREVATNVPIRKVLSSKERSANGPFLRFMAEQGFREYRDLGIPARRKPSGCDVSGQQANSPTLFVFPYDWRQDNATTADQLRDYLLCVRMFYPNAKINIIAHSMGNYVTRRYLLQYPDDGFVNALISVGAPFLGGPKLAYVLETGDFGLAPATPNSTIKAVVGSFTAAQQIIPGQAYLDLGGPPIFVEEGYDFDGNGISEEAYDYAKLTRFLDSRYGRAGFLPGTTARKFHDWDFAGREDDWRQDAPNVKYFHIFGQTSVPDTIAQTVVTLKPRCHRNGEGALDCLPFDEPEIILRYVYGDRTVPLISASRQGTNGLNYNAPHARTFLCRSTGSLGLIDRLLMVDKDLDVEHTGMLSNPVIDYLLLDFLAEAAGAPPKDLPESTACGNFRTAAANRGTTALVATAEATDSTGYFARISGVEDVLVQDSLGNSSALISDTLPGRVPGVTLNQVGPRQQEVVLTPGESYELTFRTTAEPLVIDLTRADETTTMAAIRYRDLTLPPGVMARLRFTPSAVENLYYDGDGNGSYESEVLPTATSNGAAAADTNGPTLSYSATPAGAAVQVTLSAQDPSGVVALYYSTNGTTFQPYNTPLTLDPTVTPILYTFADDTLANRSAVQFFYLPNPNAPDLAVAVTASGGVQVGDTINYAVTVNNSSAAATTASILLTDTLPIGSTFVSAGGDGWSCQQGSGVVTCSHAGPLAGNAALPLLTIATTTGVQSFPTAYNLVKVATAGDTNPTNNVTETLTALKSVTDLALQKRHHDPFSVGALGSYTLTVSNVGPLPAMGPFTVVDTLPAGLTFVSAAGSGWACNNQAQTVTCTYGGSLGAGALPPLVIGVQVGEGALGGVTNRATVSAANIVDTNSNNNQAADPTVIVEGANLNLFARSDALQGEYVVPWVVGQQRTYNLYVGNAGPSTAQAPITVTATLSGGVQFMGDTSAEWDCSALGQQVTCTATQPMDAGVNSSFAISVAVDSNAFPAVTSSFAINSITPDANPADNTSSDTTQVYYGGDLAATVSAPRPLAPGDNLYVIGVQNLGPIDIDQPINVLANLAPEVADTATIVAFAGDNWSCSGLPVFAACSYPAPVGVNAPLAPLTLTVQTNGAIGTRLDVDFQVLIAQLDTVLDPNRSNNNFFIRRFVGIATMPPALQDDYTGTQEDQAVVVDILANDFEPDYDPMTISAVGAPTRGAAVINGNAIRYTPAPNVNGSDSFTYTVSDGVGGVANATVFVDIYAVNDTPTAANDTATVAQNGTITIPVLLNDGDVDGDTLTISAVGTAAHGVTLIEGNAIRYTPAAGYSGSDSFTYTISDPSNAQASATVNLTVTPLQDMRPRITIRLDSQPDSVQNYRFNGSTGLPATFRLDDITPQDTDSFSNAISFTVNPGSYSVTELVPSGRYLTAINCDLPNKVTVDLSAGKVTFNVGNGDAVSCTFVNQHGVTIRTRTYTDLNRNGRRNVNEPFVNGWAITVYLTPTNTVIASGVTAVDGRVNFAYLRPGAYAVCVTPQAGFVNSDPGIINPLYQQPCELATLAPAQGVTMLFGNYQSIPVLAAATTAEAEVAEPTTWVLWEYPDVTDEAGYDGNILTDNDPDILDTGFRLYLPLINH